MIVCSGRRFWNFHRWSGDCANAVQENLPDRVHEISESCSQMVLHFHNQVEVFCLFKKNFFTVIDSLRPLNVVVLSAFFTLSLLS